MLRSVATLTGVLVLAALTGCGEGEPEAISSTSTISTATVAPTAAPTAAPTPPPTAVPPVIATTVPTTVPAATSTTTIPSAPLATLPPDPSSLPAPTAVAAPTIGMQSTLEHMGLQDDDGGVAVPTDFARAGWYQFGGRPNAVGPTVLVGHVDSRSGPAVFYGLRDLQPGDPIEVTLADGTVATYAVTTTEQFPKDEFPTFAVFGGTGEDVVKLITCTGEFDRSIRSYDDNLVVTAVRTA